MLSRGTIVAVAAALSWSAGLHAATFDIGAGDVAALVAAIDSANGTPEADTINLAAGAYVLTAVATSEPWGPSGLPTITSDIALVGAGSGATTIERDGSAPAFRFLTITGGRTTLSGVTLQGGLAVDDGVHPQSPAGGAVFNEGDLEIQDVVLRANYAQLEGGAIFSAERTWLTDVVMEDNQVGVSGGALFLLSGNLTLARATVTNNDAGVFGGAMAILGSQAEISDTSITGNTSPTGGLDAHDSEVFLSRVAITGNVGTYYVGGVGISGFARVTIDDSLIAGNTSDEAAGLRVDEQAVVLMTNTTVSGNHATGDGGGVFVDGPGSAGIPGRLIAVNSTIAGNTADSDLSGHGGGGGIFVELGGRATFRAVLLGDNVANEGMDCLGTVTSDGYNLIETVAGCTVKGTKTGNVVGVDPLLGALGPNGGATDSMPLLPGSPAIDAAEYCPGLDQRGFARPVDGNGDTLSRCDIGAVEQEALLASLTPADTFFCYKDKREAWSPAFVPVPSLAFDDAIETSSYGVNKHNSLCSPATTAGDDIADRSISLMEYTLRKTPATPFHMRQVGLRVSNRFGAVTLDTVKPSTVLIPAQTSYLGPVAPPNPVDHDVDTFRCYDVKPSKGSRGLAKAVYAVVHSALPDDYFKIRKLFAVGKPRRLCVASSIDGAGVESATAALLCHQVKAAKPLLPTIWPDPVFARIPAINTGDAFGQLGVMAIKEESLCVPSIINP
ncbi:MAG: hypothetical protein KIT14_11020 [bacterium]|nr:hypothetical protein [bacterium]